MSPLTASLFFNWIFKSMKSLFLRMLNFQLKAFINILIQSIPHMCYFYLKHTKRPHTVIFFPTMDNARSDWILTESNYSILYFTTSWSNYEKCTKKKIQKSMTLTLLFLLWCCAMSKWDKKSAPVERFQAQRAEITRKAVQAPCGLEHLCERCTTFLCWGSKPLVFIFCRNREHHNNNWKVLFNYGIIANWKTTAVFYSKYEIILYYFS